MNPSRAPSSIQVDRLGDGTLQVRNDRGILAWMAPEVFTEGWKKHGLVSQVMHPSFDGLILLADGEQIGLKAHLTAGASVLKIRVVLVPLEPVRVIHLRFVISLPEPDWLGAAFRLGARQGSLAPEVPAQNRLAEGVSKPLLIGPSPLHGGLLLNLDAEGLTTVLQDNRQWSPFFQAFVTAGEPADPPWFWDPQSPKTLDFALSFVDQPSKEANL